MKILDSNLSPVIEDCEPLSNHCLSEWLFLPAYPILFGFFQFIYFTNRSANEFKENIAADFVCFNVKHCPILLTKNVSIKMLNELNCSHISEFTKSLQIKTFNEIYFIFSSLEEFCLKKGLEESCQNSSYFYCNKSMKCIRNHRVVDGTSDCFFDEDELFDACQFNHSNRFKCKLNTRKCLMHVAIGNGFTNCQSEEDELFVYTQNLITLISFTDLCNLKINDNILSLKIIETDETNCHLWPCDNPYKHCDQRNHCPNGIDELNCPDTKCSFNEFECLNNRFELSYCIPLNHIYEKYLYYYNDTYTKLFRQIYFYNGTNNINEEYFSWNSTKCITLNNLYLINHHLLTEEDICLYQSRSLTISNIQDIKLFQNNESLCNFKPDRISSRNVIYFFKATRLGYLQKISTDISVPTILKPIQENKTINHIDSALISHCHRGIPVLTGQNKTIKCFCPPNYFGSQCQWQNQRISLTLQLHCPSTIYTNVVFQLLIIIIDQDGQILPYHEQITYIPNRDCNTKFNIYLLYPDRPKSLSNNYSIRIDLYEKTILNSWTSWFISIPFQFLPVNRISTQLIIPEIQNNDLCTLSCGEYGKCRRYINNKSSFFCQCDQGYSGSQCQIKSQCNCSNDSFCFHPSICICPLNKFGFYCHLTHSVCQSLNNSCQHNGLCIPTDDWINLRAFTCFCSDDYSGERCQNKNNQIDIHLDETIISNNHFICILRQKFSCLKI